MAEQDPGMPSPGDDRLRHRYRELSREEPPPSLDAAIRAKARSAVETHPAPLVPPTGRRSWYFPLAAAAVIVLAVAVTWQVEREQGDPGASSPAPATQAPAPPSEGKPRATPTQPQAAPTKPQAAPKEEAFAPARRDERPAKTKKLDEPQVADNLAKQAAPAAERSARALSSVAEAPEHWLERIAALRKEGRHDDADRELAEFRKRYPEFKIPAQTLEKVEKR